MKKFLVFFMALMIVGSIFVSPFDFAYSSGITSSLKLDKAVYKKGETIKIHYELKNNISKDVEFTFSNAQVYDFAVYLKGKEKEPVFLWSKERAFAEVITKVTVKAKSSLAYDETFDTSILEKDSEYTIMFWLPVQGSKGKTMPYMAQESFRLFLEETSSNPFKDIEKHWAYQYILKLYNMGIITGYPDKTFRPESSVSRAEALKLVLTAFKTELIKPEKPSFVDVKETHWAYQYVETAYAKGFIEPVTEKTFNPNKEITREAFAMLLVKAANFEIKESDYTFKDVPKDDKYAPFIYTLYEMKIIEGIKSGTELLFQPKKPIKRGEVAAMLVRALEYQGTLEGLVLPSFVFLEKPSLLFRVEETPVSAGVSYSGYEINKDFSNVINFKDFSFSDSEISKLESNLFFIKPNNYTTFTQYYIDTEKSGYPSFITSDTLISLSNNLFKAYLRHLEGTYLREEVKKLLENLLLFNKSLLVHYTGTTLRESIIRNVSFCITGLRLLDSNYFGLEGLTRYEMRIIDNLVKSELSLIEKHEGFADSPIFGYEEDYSQYKVRGHYTKSKNLETYFKTMMYLGRARFLLKGENVLHGRSLTRSALFMVSGLSVPQNYKTFRKIYETITFFAGEKDDLDLYDYSSLAFSIFKENPKLSDFENDLLIDEFIEKGFKDFKNPRINSSGALSLELNKGFKVLGQRFSFDTYIFQRLVFPFVPQRKLPKSLDIPFVFGSSKAENLLKRMNETDYQGYIDSINYLKDELKNEGDIYWFKNLYNLNLSLINILAKEKPYAPFMENEAWKSKSLITSIFQYTNLKHTTLLYVKQSYTPKVSPQKSYIGYLEIQPELYNRLLTMIDSIILNFESIGLLNSEWKSKFEELKYIYKLSLEISLKELKAESLLEKEEFFLKNFSMFLKNLYAFSPEISKTALVSGEEEASLVVDVHTDANSSICLEEGIGYLYDIFVIVKTKDGYVISKGAIPTVYEFTKPINERLNDDEFKNILKQGNLELPFWIKELLP